MKTQSFPIQSLLVSMLALSTAWAQGVPPPKPEDTGPSLADTMKFIQDKLNEQGQVNYVGTFRNRTTNTLGAPRNSSATMSDVAANPKSCMISISIAMIEPDALGDQRIEFSFQEVEKLAVSPFADVVNRMNAERGHTEFTFETSPSVFSLSVQMMHSKTIKNHSHILPEGQQAKDVESNSDNTLLRFREEEMAQRIAKAMVHAVELCGGGSKDPF